MLNTCQGSAALIPHFKIKVSNMRHKRQWSEWISTEVSNKTNSRTEGRKNPTSCLRKPQRGNAVSCIWGRRDIFFIITGHQNWQQICFCSVDGRKTFSETMERFDSLKPFKVARQHKFKIRLLADILETSGGERHPKTAASSLPPPPPHETVDQDKPGTPQAFLLLIGWTFDPVNYVWQQVNNLKNQVGQRAWRSLVCLHFGFSFIYKNVFVNRTKITFCFFIGFNESWDNDLDSWQYIDLSFT